MKIAHLLLLVSAATLYAGCPDATEVAEQCVAADLIGQCPAGSNPVLGASASAACGGSFDLHVVTEEGSATGQCSSNGTCEFLCQYTSPCTCGISTLSKDQIICSVCPDQSCGDGRCEGTERASCEGGPATCLACLEDCGGSTCGDGDCTGTESPQTCPQDCENLCIPNDTFCFGNAVKKCAADGSQYVEVDCTPSGLICGNGQCVAPGACGNGACEPDESSASCPQDCGTVCVPNNVSCQGNTLVTCDGTGDATTELDCTTQGLVCARGECKPADVCGNGLCESGEEASCAQDCAAVCGNRICENGESSACPQDCTVCGDQNCGAGEIDGCPQDCGICIPSERVCLGQLLRVCNANGTAYDDIDCRAFDQTCAVGTCLEPDVCGNGACEVGEDATSCATDCTIVCGDDQCDPGETFTSCSSDCQPACGNGSCEGNEDFAGCPLDCLATCGNGTCNGGEDRETCPRDCGFCGNGVCEDGAESGSRFPPEPLTTCLPDCVRSSCDEDADCDDGIGCTVGDCDAGTCRYEANDALCGATSKCIKFSGCCEDADNDGFASAACGGSDCDDDAPLVFPGAFEPCGGGDRNCNGVHRPALKPAKKITATPSFKTRLAMTFDGTRFWAAWNGVPELEKEIQYAAIGKDGVVIGAIRSVADEVAYGGRPALAWDANNDQLGIAFPTFGSAPDEFESPIRFLVVDASGVPTGTSLALSGPSQYAYGDIEMVWSNGHYVVASFGGFFCNGGFSPACTIGWFDISEGTNVSSPWGRIAAAKDLVVVGDQVVGLIASGFTDRPTTFPALAKVTPGATTDTYTHITIGSASADGTCALGHDGDSLVHVCNDLGRVYYNRLAANGAELSSSIVRDQNIVPSDIAVAPNGLAAGDTAKVAVVSQDAAGNIVFFVRDTAGAEVVSPATVGGGANAKDATVFWDGDAFQVFWLAPSGAIEQLYKSTVTCE